MKMRILKKITMNRKTARLLKKSANIMSFLKTQKTGKQVDTHRVYQGLKSQWKNKPWNERNKIRKALKNMVMVAESK